MSNSSRNRMWEYNERQLSPVEKQRLELDEKIKKEAHSTLWWYAVRWKLSNGMYPVSMSVRTSQWNNEKNNDATNEWNNKKTVQYEHFLKDDTAEIVWGITAKIWPMIQGREKQWIGSELWQLMQSAWIDIQTLAKDTNKKMYPLLFAFHYMFHKTYPTNADINRRNALIQSNVVTSVSSLIASWSHACVEFSTVFHRFLQQQWYQTVLHGWDMKSWWSGEKHGFLTLRVSWKNFVFCPTNPHSNNNVPVPLISEISSEDATTLESWNNCMIDIQKRYLVDWEQADQWNHVRIWRESLQQAA